MTSLTIELDDDTARALGAAAEERSHSAEALASFTVRARFDEDVWLIEQSQAGLAAIARGEVVDEAEADRRIEALLSDLPRE